MSDSERALEERSRTLFQDSVDNVDMRVRSRLTQARHAALAAAQPGGRAAFRTSRWKLWTPAVGATAAVVLGIGLWMGGPGIQPSGVDQTNFDDLDLVASSDGSADAMDMMQDDIDFYDFADKADSGNGPTA
jgi:hypothetical protein